MDNTADNTVETPRWVRVLLWFLQAKVAIPLMIVLCLLAAPFVFRAYRIAGLPDIGDPFDVEAFGTIEISDEENAFVEYAEATALYVDTPIRDTDALSKALEEGWSAADDDVRTWLEDNRPALEVWRKGTKKPGALYHQPKDVSYDTMLPVSEKLRTFSRLARLEGSRLESNGNTQEAWRWYRAIFRCSRHSGMHADSIERLRGIALHATVAEAMVKWAENFAVDEPQLQQALENVIADYKMTTANSTGLKSDYLSLMNAVNQLDDEELIDILGIYGMVENIMISNRVMLYLFNERELSRRVWKQIFANWLSQIDRPRHSRPLHVGYLGLFSLKAGKLPSPDSLTPDEIQKYIDRSYLARLLLPAVTGLDNAITREESRQAALVVALAAQIYYRQHAEFPEKLEDLLDGPLDHIPADPFGNKGDLVKYRREKDRTGVWCVGSNGFDDGGNLDPAVPFEDRDIGFEIKPPAENDSNVDANGQEKSP